MSQSWRSRPEVGGVCVTTGLVGGGLRGDLPGVLDWSATGSLSLQPNLRKPTTKSGPHAFFDIFITGPYASPSFLCLLNP